MSGRWYLITVGLLLTLAGVLLVAMKLTDMVGDGQPVAAAVKEEARVKPRPTRLRSTTGERTFERRKIASMVVELEEELAATQAKLEELSRPLYDYDVLSSVVNAEIADGESLVTGGYRLEDGRYEITFLTPRGYDLSGENPGNDQIKVEARSMVVDEAFVAASGLDSLTTKVRNTLQHAEAWSGDDVFDTFQSAADFQGVDMASFPTVMVVPDEDFKVEMLDEESGRGFRMSGTAGFSVSGNFALQTRIERKE